MSSHTIAEIEAAAELLTRLLPHILQGVTVEQASDAVALEDREMARVAAIAELDRERERKVYAEAQADRTRPPSALMPNWRDASHGMCWYCINPRGIAYWSECEPRISIIGDDWTWDGGYVRAQSVNIPLGVDWRTLKYAKPVVGVAAVAPEPRKKRAT